MWSGKPTTIKFVNRIEATLLTKCVGYSQNRFESVVCRNVRLFLLSTRYLLQIRAGEFVIALLKIWCPSAEI